MGKQPALICNRNTHPDCVVALRSCQTNTDSTRRKPRQVQHKVLQMWSGWLHLNTSWLRSLLSCRLVIGSAKKHVNNSRTGPPVSASYLTDGYENGIDLFIYFSGWESNKPSSLAVNVSQDFGPTGSWSPFFTYYMSTGESDWKASVFDSADVTLETLSGFGTVTQQVLWLQDDLT